MTVISRCSYVDVPEPPPVRYLQVKVFEPAVKVVYGIARLHLSSLLTVWLVALSSLAAILLDPLTVSPILALAAAGEVNLAVIKAIAFVPVVSVTAGPAVAKSVNVVDVVDCDVPM